MCGITGYWTRRGDPAAWLRDLGASVEALRNRGRIGQRRSEPLAEQPRTGDRHGAVDRIAERTAPLARERAHQFEVGARRRIDHQARADSLTRRRRERRP